MLKDGFAGDERARTADLDARLLVGHALGLDAAGLVVHAGRPVTEAEAACALALVGRRIAGEPVARIIGEKAFWTLDLLVSPETLVPRPDTETVVSAVLAWAKREGRERAPLSVLDLGTGTGAILLALLSELPAASGVGVDRSEGAARTARENAARHRLDGRARFVVGDWTSPLRARFDIVASNPPYIASAEIPGLAVEVSRFDPNMSLDGGPDGLAAYRAIFDALDGVLAGGGAAFFEVGVGMAEAVGGIAARLGFDSVRHRDLAGIERVVEVVRGKASRQKIGLEIGLETARFASP